MRVVVLSSGFPYPMDAGRKVLLAVSSILTRVRESDKRFGYSGYRHQA